MVNGRFNLPLTIWSEKTTLGVINCCWISLHWHFKYTDSSLVYFSWPAHLLRGFHSLLHGIVLANALCWRLRDAALLCNPRIRHTSFSSHIKGQCPFFRGNWTVKNHSVHFQANNDWKVFAVRRDICGVFFTKARNIPRHDFVTRTRYGNTKLQ